MTASSGAAQPVTRAFRLWLLGDCAILTIAGFQLYILSDYTSHFFAWTIAPPLTAAFLGAGYWASIPTLYLSSRQSTWARARLSVPSVFLFSVLTTAATFIHLDRFHLTSSDPIAQAAAWVWLIVYLAFPPGLLAFWVLQTRQPGQEPARQATLPLWFRAVLILQSAIMIGVGAVLTIAPTASIWPWTLTPLTGRAIGAWLVGFGVVAAQASWENDWHRVDAGLLGFAIGGVLEALALLRYSGTVNWSGLSVWLYLLFLVGMILVGGYGWLQARQT